MNLEEGFKSYREGVLALLRIIDDHFPPDEIEVLLARSNVLESVGRLKCVLMDHKERAKRSF